jgi:hypothetical protein
MKRTGFLLKETLNKSHFLKIRHSGESRYPLPPFRGKIGWGYIIVFWMPVCTGMTVKTLLQRFLKTAIVVLAILFCTLASADAIIIKLAYVGDTGNSAYLGAQQGLSEANLQGKFMNQQYVLDAVTTAEALNTDYAPYLAVIAAVDHNTYRKLLDKLPNVPVFNVTLEDDDLRTACLPNALHIVASRQMKQDAVAQWQKKNPKAQVTARTWHHEFVKFAGRDLNKRFSKNYKQPMDDAAWAGWAAVKMSSDTVARENITDPAKLLDYLKTSLLFDGQMGIEMNFRTTGQLRQPLLLIENGKIAGEAPVKGVANPTDLDSLGNVECAK